MTFDELLALVFSNNAPVLCADSRLVKDGDIFVAIKGTTYDGHDFIDEALANGAKYIVCQGREAHQEKKNTQYAIRDTQYEIIIVDDSPEAAASLAQAGRGNPASQLTNLAVTGTNGKTTVAYLVRSVIQKAGEKCGLISTIIYDTCSASCEAALTTPDCLQVAEKQEQMLKAGSRYMVIEVSSHALSQNRLAGLNFKAAAFTNLASDHLDYHKTKADYLAAKTKLFQGLLPDATAVLNKQSPEAKQIAEKTNAKILWYAVDEEIADGGQRTADSKKLNAERYTLHADLTAHIKSMDITGTTFTIKTRATSDERRATIKTPLFGRYNVSNHLAAAGLCLAAGFDLQTIAAGLSTLKTIPGRLEKIKLTAENAESAEKELKLKISAGSASSAVKEVDFSVFIDYAHTDDALKNVLSTLKSLCKGKLTLVFGCGGDRDRTKRPRMARVAEQLADFIIVTSDNPRTEKPEDIIDEIVAGFEKGPPIQSKEIRNTQYAIRNTKIIEPDRKKAIELAIKTAGKNDIVLIAGKGHEKYQIIGKQKFNFSDKAIARECLAKRK